MVCCKKCKHCVTLSQNYRIGMCDLDKWTFDLDDYTMDETECDFYVNVDSDNSKE